MIMRSFDNGYSVLVYPINAGYNKSNFLVCIYDGNVFIAEHTVPTMTDVTNAINNISKLA